jgi:Protein of unknown function (DUF3631)
MPKKIVQKTSEDPIDRMLSVNNPTPCMEPVDAKQLFAEIIQVLKRYIVMSDHAAIGVALWIIHTYCYERFGYSPILMINSPERGCGKSVALGTVAKFVPRPLECANITVAALFRVVENRKPTVLLDEADTFLEGKPDLAGILNKGFEQGGMVLRVETVGDRFVEVGYRVYGPKALAGIALERHLPDATLSRGIQIPMRKRIKGEAVERLRCSDPNMFSRLRSQINQFVHDYEEQLSQGYSDMPEELDDRAQDCWEPLFTIASCIGTEALSMARAAALATNANNRDVQSVSNSLLACVREVLMGYEGKYIPTADLVEKLTNDADMGWNIYNKGFPITPRQLSNNLKPYGIEPKTVRISDKYTPKGYELYDFKDAFERYLKPVEINDVINEIPAASSSTLLIRESELDMNLVCSRGSDVSVADSTKNFSNDYPEAF